MADPVAVELVREQVDRLAGLWERSEHECVLPRRQVTDAGVKHRLVPESAPPQPLELLNARCEVDAVISMWTAAIANDRRDHAPSGVPEALNYLHRWCPSLADEDANEMYAQLRRAGRLLAAALDGSSQRVAVARCPSLECGEAGIMLRAIPGALGVSCSWCGRRWIGTLELEQLRRLVAVA